MTEKQNATALLPYWSLVSFICVVQSPHTKASSTCILASLKFRGLLSYFIFSKNIPRWLGSSHDGKGVWGREMHQQVQHSESSTLHTLTPPDELIKGLVKAVKVALNEKYEIFPKKIGALV